MQLLTPIWLTALVALAVPVLIHLWNIRPGKTLKVGSIQWFEEASPANSRSLKLLDVLLLMLRCLLLALVSILLATPVWQRYLSDKKAKGWVLIPEASLNVVRLKYKTQLDSLQKLGYEFHLLAPGFNNIDTGARQANSPQYSLNYWQLVKQLPQAVSTSVPIQLFTPNTLSYFKGDRPATQHNITWNTFTPADSVRTWLAGAWLTPSDGLRVVQGNSKPSGIGYQYFNVTGDGKDSPFNIYVNNGRPVVSLKNDASVKIDADTVTMHIAIYAGKNSTDAHYLEAGLRAVEKFSQRKMQIDIYRQASKIPQAGDWLFWLSDEPVNKTSAPNVFYYMPGKKAPASTWIDNGEAQGNNKPALHQTIAAKANTGNALWTDGTGRTILAKQQAGQNNLYPFYTRLNPAYTDLVWDERFPLWLLKLIAKPLAGPIVDTRSLDNRQIQPIKISGLAKTEIAPKQQVSITNYLWLALALLFFAERWLAYRNQTKTTNG